MASVACRPMCVGRLTHAISDSAALDVPGSQLFRVICHAAGRSLQCDGRTAANFCVFLQKVLISYMTGGRHNVVERDGQTANVVYTEVLC